MTVASKKPQGSLIWDIILVLMGGKHKNECMLEILVIFFSSLKTQENLKTVKELPSDRLLLETDCPWCEIRPTHAGHKYIAEENKAFPSVKKEKWNCDHMVKSRNEPINIR